MVVDYSSSYLPDPVGLRWPHSYQIYRGDRLSNMESLSKDSLKRLSLLFILFVTVLVIHMVNHEQSYRPTGRSFAPVYQMPDLSDIMPTEPQFYQTRDDLKNISLRLTQRHDHIDKTCKKHSQRIRNVSYNSISDFSVIFSILCAGLSSWSLASQPALITTIWSNPKTECNLFQKNQILPLIMYLFIQIFHYYTYINFNVIELT